MMEELSINEMILVDGGSNLGNALLAAGSMMVAIGCSGPVGIIAGGVCVAMGLLSGWE